MTLKEIVRNAKEGFVKAETNYRYNTGHPEKMYLLHSYPFVAFIIYAGCKMQLLTHANLIQYKYIVSSTKLLIYHAIMVSS